MPYSSVQCEVGFRSLCFWYTGGSVPWGGGTGELWLVIRQRDGRMDRVRSVILEAITSLGRPREARGGV